MENKNLSEQMAEILNSLTDEQKEKVKACKDVSELTALLGEMGIALPDELLDAAAGGLGQTWGTWQDFPVYPGRPGDEPSDDPTPGEKNPPMDHFF